MRIPPEPTWLPLLISPLPRPLRRSLWRALALALLTQHPGRAQAQEERRLPELLEMSIEELLDTEVITAGKTWQRVGEIPASIVILTREDIQSYGFNTLEEVLQSVPGLYGIDDYGEGGVLFGIRGFWSGVANDNVIVLVNGVPQTKNVFSNHPIPEIPVPVEAIDRIEVVRGPMSVVYGSGAFFGAINIITNDALGGASGNRASMAVGTGDNLRLFARTARSGVDFDFAANASFQRVGGPDVPARDLMSDPSILPDFGVSEDWRTGEALGADRYFFNLSGAYQGLSLDLVAVSTRLATQFQYPSFSDGQIVEYSDLNFSLGYRSSLSETLTLDAHAGIQTDKTAFDYDFLFEDFFGIQHTTSKSVEGTVDLFFRPRPELGITSGLYYRSILEVGNAYDLPGFGVPSLENVRITLDPNDDIVTRALYGQIQATPLPGLEIVAGARMEQSPKYRLSGWRGVGTPEEEKVRGTYEAEDIEFIPRLALLYRPGGGHVVKALFGRAINRPSFFQNYLQMPYPERPDLLPEDITTFELNYLASLGAAYAVEASYFHNVLDNLITRIIVLDEHGEYQGSWSANAGRLVTNGVEVTLAAEPGDGTRLEASGTYQATEDQRPGFQEIDVAYSPRFLAQFRARTRLRPNLTAALLGLYVSGMEPYWDETPRDPGGGTLDPVGRIGERVDGYLTVDANLRMENLLRDGFWMGLRVSNILDADVRYPTFSNNQWANRGTLGHGRRWIASLGLAF